MALNGPLSFGRVASNQVVLPDEKVSRRHALIHPQGEREFWMVDLGSRNGTYVNQRRLSQPLRLRDGDQIQIGPFNFVFHQASARTPTDPEKDQSTLVTLVDVRALACWLLVADMESSTDLAKSLPPDELAIVMGRWLLNCKRVVEANAGTVNKYLGDGFLAYWRATEVGANQIATALNSLRELQSNIQPRFRFVVHRAEVTFGGVASLGEESLSGTAVNFVFRMEKVASLLGSSVLLSEPATTALAAILPLVPLGEHSVPSFEGLHRFFAL
jgi:adenylate cyclase